MKFIFLLLMANCAILVKAQQVVATAGSSLSNVNGSISFTIGESITQTLTSSDKVLTQGFQQAGITVSVINELKNPDYSITAFPNPAIDFLRIKISRENIEGFQYYLYDENGKLLVKKQISDRESLIFLKLLPEGIYIIRVLEGSKELKSFKIVKL